MEDSVRKEKASTFKNKDDKWLKDQVYNGNMNSHWAWYHIMEHEANHMGQIRLII